MYLSKTAAEIGRNDLKVSYLPLISLQWGGGISEIAEINVLQFHAPI